VCLVIGGRLVIGVSTLPLDSCQPVRGFVPVSMVLILGTILAKILTFFFPLIMDIENLERHMILALLI